MNMNEMAIMQQLASNPQFVAQFLQILQQQQNGMNSTNQGNPSQPMNWNMPTNPMASWWYNTMNNQNNNQQSTQNQPQSQPSVTQTQEVDNQVSSVRVIKSPDEIKAEEIPMNGTIGLFLQDDLSVIYGKRWTGDGVVDNLRFVLENADQKEVVHSSDVSNSTINPDALFEKISEMIDAKLSRFNSSNKNASAKNGNNKKGVEENGG